jgi:homoserine O-succinyltransferase/O-acetyltransferase
MPVLSVRSLTQELQPRECAGDPIVVGLVNNMPDAALRTTERQFHELLSTASNGLAVCLRLFSLPELARTPSGRSHVAQFHEDISELWTSHLDGLIVTGTEPRAPALASEPYWGTLTKLVEWAEDRTISTVWSCLAAHAAVLHVDGVARRALPAKLTGVFDCMKSADHTIVAGLPSRWRLPHSRYNELPQEGLVAKGYRVLATSRAAGADMFIKQRESLFVFFQGHPEYDPGALLREYRRDIGRFLAGERDSYPAMPEGYLDQNSAAAFIDFRQRALRYREVGLLSSFPATEAQGKLLHVWREPAIRIYANWLTYLAEHRARGRHPTASHVPRERVAI